MEVFYAPPNTRIDFADAEGNARVIEFSRNGRAELDDPIDIAAAEASPVVGTKPPKADKEAQS